GRQRADEVGEDPVGDVLVEGALVAVGPHVELQGLQLDEPAVGHVPNPDGREVRLTGHRADARELGHYVVDLVVPVGVRIGNALEILRWGAGHRAAVSIAPALPTRPPAARRPRPPALLRRPERYAGAARRRRRPPRWTTPGSGLPAPATPARASGPGRA